MSSVFACILSVKDGKHLMPEEEEEDEEDDVREGEASGQERWGDSAVLVSSDECQHGRSWRFSR